MVQEASAEVNCILPSLFQIVAFVLEAFFAEMELEKAGESDVQVRLTFVLITSYHYTLVYY